MTPQFDSSDPLGMLETLVMDKRRRVSVVVTGTIHAIRGVATACMYIVDGTSLAELSLNDGGQSGDETGITVILAMISVVLVFTCCKVFRNGLAKANIITRGPINLQGDRRRTIQRHLLGS